MMRRWFAGPGPATRKYRGGPPVAEVSEGGMRSITQARQANDRAAMGLTLTSGRAMSAETRIQATMAAMLEGMDRGRDAVD